MKIKHSELSGACPCGATARATGASVRRLARLVLAFVLIAAGAAASAEPRRHAVVLADHTDVAIRIHPARGELLVLWLPSGYSRPEAYERTIAGLAARGIEVWEADLLEARFLPPLESSLEQVSPRDVAELIEAAHGRSGKRVVLFASARAAVLALAGAQVWQARHPGGGALAGAVLMHPNLYVAPPEPGREAEYHPVVARTRLPVFILQPELSPWYWRLKATVNKLEQGGAQVRVRELPGVRDRFDTRSDANARERLEAQGLPELLARAAGEVAPIAVAAPRATVAEPAAAGAATERPRARELKPYAGRAQAPPLALARLDGGAVDLAAVRGRVVLVNFWASWCPPCVREMPSMQRLADKMAGRPFDILAVNMGESEREIRAFLARMPVDFPVLLDRDGAALRRWKVFVFPTSFVLDAAGRIRYGVFGEVEWDAPEVLELLEGLMPEGAPAAKK